MGKSEDNIGVFFLVKFCDCFVKLWFDGMITGWCCDGEF